MRLRIRCCYACVVYAILWMYNYPECPANFTIVARVKLYWSGQHWTQFMFHSFLAWKIKCDYGAKREHKAISIEEKCFAQNRKMNACACAFDIFIPAVVIAIFFVIDRNQSLTNDKNEYGGLVWKTKQQQRKKKQANTRKYTHISFTHFLTRSLFYSVGNRLFIDFRLHFVISTSSISLILLLLLLLITIVVAVVVCTFYLILFSPTLM